MKSCGCFLFGGEYEARTRDLLHAMQALSQLSYAPDSLQMVLYKSLSYLSTGISHKICAKKSPTLNKYAVDILL